MRAASGLRSSKSMSLCSALAHVVFSEADVNSLTGTGKEEGSAGGGGAGEGSGMGWHVTQLRGGTKLPGCQGPIICTAVLQ